MIFEVFTQCEHISFVDVTVGLASEQKDELFVRFQHITGVSKYSNAEGITPLNMKTQQLQGV